MVVNHVPAYPSFRNIEGAKGKEGTGEPNRKHWVPLFDQYRVPVVLEHHEHTFKRTRPLLDGRPNDKGVLYLGDGSWGRLRQPQSPEKLPYLAVSSRDYHLSLHRIEGEERFHVALDEFWPDYGRVPFGATHAPLAVFSVQCSVFSVQCSVKTACELTEH